MVEFPDVVFAEIMSYFPKRPNHGKIMKRLIGEVSVISEVSWSDKPLFVYAYFVYKHRTLEYKRGKRVVMRDHNPYSRYGLLY